MTPRAADRREVLARVWYPAAGAVGLRAPYVWDLEALRPALGASVANRLAAVRTHSRANVAIRATGGPYPVVVFSPSLAGARYSYTTLAENLASHGYVVVGIDHPYDGGAVAFPDGRVARHSEVWSQKEPGVARIEEFFRFRADRVAVMADDASFVLDRLADLNTGRPASGFDGRLDLDRVGYFGHSLGGVVASLACDLEPRIRACVDLDGWPLQGRVEATGLGQPFMYVEETRANPTDARLADWELSRARYDVNVAALDARKELLLRRSRAAAYHLRIDGVTHHAFSDRLLVGRGAGRRPGIEPARAVRIVNAYLLAFFDRYLRGADAPLLDHGAERYPEAHLKVYRPLPVAAAEPIGSTFPGARDQFAAQVEVSERLAGFHAEVTALAREGAAGAGATRSAAAGALALGVVVGDEPVWSAFYARDTDDLPGPTAGARDRLESARWALARALGREMTAAAARGRDVSAGIDESGLDWFGLEHVGRVCADGVPVSTWTGAARGYDAAVYASAEVAIGVVVVSEPGPAGQDVGASSHRLVGGVARGFGLRGAVNLCR